MELKVSRGLVKNVDRRIPALTSEEMSYVRGVTRYEAEQCLASIAFWAYRDAQEDPESAGWDWYNPIPEEIDRSVSVTTTDGSVNIGSAVAKGICDAQDYLHENMGLARAQAIESRYTSSPRGIGAQA